MRLIGGHDYYDSALGFGRDEDIVLVRNGKTIPTKGCPLWNYYPHDICCPIMDSWRFGSRNQVTDKTGPLYLRSISVYAAGVRYGGIVVVNADNKPVETFWNQEMLETWLTGYKYKVFKPKNEIYSWYTDINERKEFPDLETWFAVTPASPEQLAWIINNRVVVAISYSPHSRYRDMKNDTWHLNCASDGWALKDWGFARAVDPYTLFQELSMFVGGVLPRNPNPMVEITDPDVKVAKHGFDKWSFRKHKDDPKVETNK